MKKRYLLPDDLWADIEPLLPKREVSELGGRPPVPDRAALTGILFVLKTGIPWEDLPLEMGCGSGVTCWRRLRDWQEAGVWPRLHRLFLARLQRADKIDWSRANLDSGSIPAPFGGEATGPNPTDRGKLGSKHPLVTDRQGIPLVIRLSAANEHDSPHFIPLLEAVPAIPGRRGRPRRRPHKLHADKGYDDPFCRAYLRRRGIRPRIARRGVESKERLGRHRWVVERDIAWLHQCRRLRVRYEKRADIHLAFLTLACSLIARRFLQRL